MAGRHSYLVCDLRTDQTLGYLPLGDVTYGRRIGVQGPLTARTPITRETSELARSILDRPCALYVYRDAQIWWGGVIWGAVPSGGTRNTAPLMNLTAATFESVPEHRRIFTDQTIDPPKDRGLVLADLWTRMQTEQAAGLNVETPPATVVGGDPWAGMWLGSSAMTWAEAMAEVATAAPALEWTIDVWANETGARTRRLRVGTPLIGPGASEQPPHLIALPSWVQSWAQPTDQTRRATHALARGASVAKNIGGEVVPVTSTLQVDTAAVAAGAPRVDALVDLDTEDPATLNAAAVSLLRATNPVPSVTVSPPPWWSFTPGALGSWGRAVINTPAAENGRMDVTRRIIGIEVKPAERGRPESIKIEFQNEDAA